MVTVADKDETLDYLNENAEFIKIQSAKEKETAKAVVTAILNMQTSGETQEAWELLISTTRKFKEENILIP